MAYSNGITVRGSPLPTRTDNLTSKAMRWAAIPGISPDSVQVSESYGESAPTDEITGGGPSVSKCPGYLSCRTIPVTYDDAGVDFPAGYVQVISGQSQGNGNQIQNFASTASGQYQSLPARRHWFFIEVLITGLPSGTTGTVELRRPADWKVYGAGDVTINTITVDGANGMVQRLLLQDVVSAPAYLDPDDSAGYAYEGVLSTALALRAYLTWSGTAPLTVSVTYNNRHLYYSPIVPTGAIPGDFTARSNTDWEHIWDVSAQRPGWSQPWKNVSGAQMGNWQFTRTGTALTDSSGGNGVAQTSMIFSSNSAALAARNVHGTPYWVCDQFPYNGSYTDYQYRGVPNVWVANDLRRMTYFPTSFGLAIHRGNFVTMTVTGTLTVTTGWQTIATGAGWRNVRFRTHASPGYTGTLSAFTVEVRMDGVSMGIFSLLGSSYTGPDGGIVDIGAALPPTRTMDCVLDFQVSATGGGAGSYYNLLVRGLPSQRIDIPLPSYVTGPGGLEAPGGYLTGSLATPLECGGTLDNAAGVTSVSWNNADARAQSRMISFVVPTTGLWKVTGPAGQDYTLGEYRFSNGLDYRGRAGKRFYGQQISGTGINGTWSLASIAQTQTAIAAGGTTLTGATCSPGFTGPWFGTIALPSAGTWRVFVFASIGSSTIAHLYSLEIGLSAVDPYVLDDIAVSGRIVACCQTPSRMGAMVSLSTPPGSPSTTAQYWITATATGAWAGREGQIAFWSNNSGWHFITPGAQTYATIDGVASFWNGSAWVPSATTRCMEMTITVAGPTTAYLRANTSCPYVTTLAPTYGNAVVTIGWEAVP